MKIEWHRLASRDLAEAITYIANENPEAAYRVHDEIQRQTSMLATHTDMGRPGRLPGTRELVITGTPFIAAYRVRGDVVAILRLLHGARRWPRGV